MDIITGIYAFIGVLKAVKEAVDAVTDVVQSVDNLIVTLRKTVDDFKNTVTEVVVIYDSDGDGENDTEEVVYRIYQALPDYETGFCICSKGNEIGLGMPMFEIIDGRDLSALLVEAPAPYMLSELPELPETSDIISEPPAVVQNYTVITGNDKYFLKDLDNDGYNDIFSPTADLTGDGINDFLKIVCNNDNGLPIASPNASFYPVGSEAFNELVGYGEDDTFLFTPDGLIIKYAESGGEEYDGLVSRATEQWVQKYGAMDKPLHNYSVSEALLFIIAAGSVVGLFLKLFRRRKF